MKSFIYTHLLLTVLINLVFLIVFKNCRLFQGEFAIWENVPQVKLHQYNEKHLHLKLNGYGVNDSRKEVVFLWFNILYLFGMVYSMYTMHVLLELILKTNHAVACVLSKVPGNLRAIFMKLVPVFLTWCLYVTKTLSTSVNITETTNSSQF